MFFNSTYLSWLTLQRKSIENISALLVSILKKVHHKYNKPTG